LVWKVLCVVESPVGTLSRRQRPRRPLLLPPPPPTQTYPTFTPLQVSSTRRASQGTWGLEKVRGGGVRGNNCAGLVNLSELPGSLLCLPRLSGAPLVLFMHLAHCKGQGGMVGEGVPHQWRRDPRGPHHERALPPRTLDPPSIQSTCILAAAGPYQQRRPLQWRRQGAAGGCRVRSRHPAAVRPRQRRQVRHDRHRQRSAPWSRPAASV
jgi:hypothetical protein